MEAKQWKTTAIIFIIITSVLVIMMAVMAWLKNRKPKWNLESLAGGIAKIKFGRKTYDYTLNTTDKPLIIGTGRYSLFVITVTDQAGTITGVAAQLFDTKTGMEVDAMQSLDVAA